MGAEEKKKKKGGEKGKQKNLLRGTAETKRTGNKENRPIVEGLKGTFKTALPGIKKRYIAIQKKE